MKSQIASIAVPLILLAGGILSLFARTTNPSNGDLSFTQEAGIALVTLGTLFLIISLIIVSVSNTNLARERALRQAEQTAVVFTIAKNDELLIGVSQAIGCSVAELRQTTPGVCMAVSGNVDGLDLWAGKKAPGKVLTVTWDEVVGMRVGSLGGTNRSTGDLTVETHKDGRDALLPFLVLGNGFGGVFPASVGERNQLIARLRALKALRPPPSRV